MVNEPSVFEPSKFYCIYIYIIFFVLGRGGEREGGMGSGQWAGEGGGKTMGWRVGAICLIYDILYHLIHIAIKFHQDIPYDYHGMACTKFFEGMLLHI